MWNYRGGFSFVFSVNYMPSYARFLRLSAVSNTKSQFDMRELNFRSRAFWNSRVDGVNLKALPSIITCSEKGKQNTQAKKVYKPLFKSCCVYLIL